MSVQQQSGRPSLDPSHIREALFSTVKRGYDPQQVLDHMRAVAEEVEYLHARIQELEGQLAEARDKLASPPDEFTGQELYDRVATHVADVVQAFDQDVDRLREERRAESEQILTEAKVEAQRILEDARTQADRIRTDAQANAEEVRAAAERTIQDAEKKAVGALSRLAIRREALLDNVRTGRDHILEALRNLDTFIHEAPSADDTVVLQDVEASANASSSAPGGEIGSTGR